MVTGNCIFQQDSSKNFDGYGYAQTNNLFADPLYENRTTKDFDLRAGSPCASKGPHAAIPEPPSEDDTAPAITQVRLANGATTRDRTPTIVATVRDAQSELLASDLRHFIDGREIGIDDRGYDQSTDQLFHTPEDYRLSFGLHKAQVIATDAQGLSASKQWSFKVIR